MRARGAWLDRELQNSLLQNRSVWTLELAGIALPLLPPLFKSEFERFGVAQPAVFGSALQLCGGGQRRDAGAGGVVRRPDLGQYVDARGPH